MRKEVIDYIVEADADSGSLSRTVITRLKEGYELYGSVAITSGSSNLFAQVLVKYGKPVRNSQGKAPALRLEIGRAPLPPQSPPPEEGT